MNSDRMRSGLPQMAKYALTPNFLDNKTYKYRIFLLNIFSSSLSYEGMYPLLSIGLLQTDATYSSGPLPISVEI